MLDFQNLDCPVCHRRFTGQDDIVVCPICGAPHHRECWKRKGHCAYEKKHGTAEQWRRPVEKSDEGALVCGNCGHVNEPNAVVCGKCGRTLEMELPPSPGEQQPPVDAGAFYSQFSPYVGIAPDSTMDGQPVMVIATFVGPNAAYYMARFHFLRLQRTKMSWNWAAAFFPVEWLLYRKMNRSFWIVLALSLVLALPYLLLTFLTLRAVIADPALMETFLASYALPADVCPPVLVFLANIGSVLSLVLRVIMAFLANHLYSRYVFRSIEKIRAECTGDRLYYRFVLSRKGGTSPLRVVLFYGAVFVLTIAAAFLLAVVLFP